MLPVTYINSMSSFVVESDLHTKDLTVKPFLIKNLENVMRRFLQSWEVFEENERKKLAIFTALAFSQEAIWSSSRDRVPATSLR